MFTQSATGIDCRGEERVVRLSDDSEAIARAVVIATGVAYRRLEIAALDRLVGMGVFYGAASAEAPALGGERVIVVGAGNSAGQAALYLARFAARVTMLVRGESLASSMSDYLVQELSTAERVEIRLRTRVVDGAGDDRLDSVIVEEARTGRRELLPAAAMFVLIGGAPRTDWLGGVLQRDEAGYIATGRDVAIGAWPLQRPPMLLETSVPGVFAVGDVRRGSVKRVAAAVGEGSVAIGAVHEHLAEVARRTRELGLA